MNAEYAKGAEPSKYIDLDFELDPSKVCKIDDPDCEACQ